MEILLYFFLLLLISLGQQEENDFCIAGNSGCNKIVDSPILKSSKDSKKFLNAIETAEANYISCEAKNCSCFLETLTHDLAPFKKGITVKMMDQVRSRGTTYVVFQKRLYRSKDCVFPARCSGVEHFLRELLPKLPNLELILNSRDWPQISKHFGDQGPVFSFSKTADYLDIHFPAWSFWEGGPAIKSYPRGIGRWDIMRQNLLKESEKWPWQKKENIGFFRGSRTSEERDALILLSRAHPNLVDAQYTKNQAWKSSQDTLHAEPASEVPLEQHCRYKYLFNMRGVAASFRLKHLFLCGSVVIHFGNEWTEFFYGPLKPWIHFVPMASDASQDDIMSMLVFLQENDHLAKAIAERGQTFIRDHLRLKDVQCYWKTLLRRYSELLNYPIALNPLLEEIR